MSANRNIRHVSQDDVEVAKQHIINVIAMKPWIGTLKVRTGEDFEDSKETRQILREMLEDEMEEIQDKLETCKFLLHAYQVDRLRNNPKYGGDKFKWENCNAHIAMCEYFRKEGDPVKPVKPVDSAKTTKTKPANKSAKSGRQATVKKSTEKKSTETKEKPEHK